MFAERPDPKTVNVAENRNIDPSSGTGNRSRARKNNVPGREGVSQRARIRMYRGNDIGAGGEVLSPAVDGGENHKQEQTHMASTRF